LEHDVEEGGIKIKKKILKLDVGGFAKQGIKKYSPNEAKQTPWPVLQDYLLRAIQS
jgi:hypothetical protein